MPWPDVCELLDHWRVFPPSYITLALVHLKQPQKFKLPRNSREAFGQLTEASKIFGKKVEPVPAQLREMVSWAMEQEKRLHKRPS